MGITVNAPSWVKFFLVLPDTPCSDVDRFRASRHLALSPLYMEYGSQMLKNDELVKK